MSIPPTTPLRAVFMIYSPYSPVSLSSQPPDLGSSGLFPPNRSLVRRVSPVLLCLPWSISLNLSFPDSDSQPISDILSSLHP